MVLSHKVQRLMNYFIEKGKTEEFAKFTEGNMISAFNALTPDEATEICHALKKMHPQKLEKAEKSEKDE